MANARFIFKEKEYTLEVPEHLVIICELTNELAGYELGKSKSYPEKDFMEMWLKEENEVSDRGYTYLINELIEIFTKSIGIDSERITMDLLNPSKSDIENNIEITGEVTDMVDIDSEILKFQNS